MKNNMRLISAALKVVWLACVAQAYRQNVNISVDVRTRMNRVVPLFGLDAGGKVDIEVNVAKAGWPRLPPPKWANMYLAFFSVEQWYEYELPNFGSGAEPEYPCQADETHQCQQLCSLPSVRRFQIWGNPHKEAQQKGMQRFEFNVTKRTEYTLVLLTCAPSGHADLINLLMDVSMVNPGNEHLSVEQRPLEGLYWAFTAIYILTIALGALAYGASLRSQGLQQCFGGTVLLKLLEVILNLSYYRTLSTTGFSDVVLLQTTRLADVLTNIAFYAILLLISLGWTITRNALTRRELQVFWGFFSLYAIFGLLHAICNKPAFCQSFLLAFYVIKFLITFCIIVAMNANIEVYEYIYFEL